MSTKQISRLVVLTAVIVSYDLWVGTSFKRKRDYLWFALASMLEPLFYHPINVFFSLRGYVKQILGTQMVWGNMTRKGVQSAQPSQPSQPSKPAGNA